MAINYDINDVIFYIKNFQNDFLTKSFPCEKIEKAKEKVLNDAFKDAERFENININKAQFEIVCKNYKDKIRSEILKY